MENKINQIDDENVIIKRYKLRATGKQTASIETTIPKEAFAREARRKGMTIKEAIEKLSAVWRYNSFKGLHLSFEIRRAEANRGNNVQTGPKKPAYGNAIGTYSNNGGYLNASE